MKKLIIISSLFFLVGLNGAFCQNPGNEKVSFSIIQKTSPSWIYKITSNDSITVDVQVRDLENKILSSHKALIKGEYITKLSTYEIPLGSEFYVVIMEGETEIYREKFKSNN